MKFKSVFIIYLLIMIQNGVFETKSLVDQLEINSPILDNGIEISETVELDQLNDVVFYYYYFYEDFN